MRGWREGSESNMLGFSQCSNKRSGPNPHWSKLDFLFMPNAITIARGIDYAN